MTFVFLGFVWSFLFRFLFFVSFAGGGWGGSSINWRFSSSRESDGLMELLNSIAFSLRGEYLEDGRSRVSFALDLSCCRT